MKMNLIDQLWIHLLQSKNKYVISPIKRTFDNRVNKIENKSISQPKSRPKQKIDSVNRKQNYSKVSTNSDDQPWFSYEFASNPQNHYRILKNKPSKNQKAKLKKTVKRNEDLGDQYDTLDSGNFLFIQCLPYN